MGDVTATLLRVASSHTFRRVIFLVVLYFSTLATRVLGYLCENASSLKGNVSIEDILGCLITM